MFERLTMKQFFSQYAPDKHRTVAPAQIQRMPCWLDKNKREYLKSFAANRAELSSFILADTRKSRDFCINEGRPEDARWFDSFLQQGIEFLILDGQNRIVALTEFMNNKFSLTGDFIDQDGNPCTIENTYFKDLPPRLKDKFYTDSKISIATVKEATKLDLLEIFLGYNEGVPLNDMQKRDATFGAIGTWVHDLSDQYENTIRRFVKDENMKASENLQFICNASMHLMQEYNGFEDSFKTFSKKTMDKWYSIGFDYYDIHDMNSPYLPEQLERVENILKDVFNVIEKQKITLSRDGKLSTRMVWAVLMTCEWLYDEGYVYQDAAEFYNQLYNIDKNLREDSEVQYGKDLEKYRISVIKGETDLTEPKVNQYYSHIANVHKNRKTRADRFKMLLEEILENSRQLTLRKNIVKQVA